MEDKFWITSRLPRADLLALGVEIGRSVRLSDGGLHCHRECVVPDEAIDPLFDLWNETKLMFGYEDDPEDQNHSESYLQMMASRGPQPDKLTNDLINRSGVHIASPQPPPVKKVAAIRRQRS